MTTSKKTTNKFKIAGLITLLAAGGIIADISYNRYSNSYDIQLKKEISQMSESQLQDAIKECDVVLERLQQTIDSEETNPEERFEARRAYKSISEHRAQFQNRLDKLQRNKKTTINFHDASKLR